MGWFFLYAGGSLGGLIKNLQVLYTNLRVGQPSPFPGHGVC